VSQERVYDDASELSCLALMLLGSNARKLQLDGAYTMVVRLGTEKRAYLVQDVVDRYHEAMEEAYKRGST
jgi:hypothetical protein